MSNFVIFTTRQWGYNQDEVAAYITQIHNEHEKLCEKYQSLLKKHKRLNEKYKELKELSEKES